MNTHLSTSVSLSTHLLLEWTLAEESTKSSCYPSIAFCPWNKLFDIDLLQNQLPTNLDWKKSWSANDRSIRENSLSFYWFFRKRFSQITARKFDQTSIFSSKYKHIFPRREACIDVIAIVRKQKSINYSISKVNILSIVCAASCRLLTQGREDGQSYTSFLLRR